MSRYRRVEVLPHDPTFVARAVEEGARIRRALGDLVVEVHHIGSTALPIEAKPLLDLLVVVHDVALLDAPKCVASMRALSYDALGEYGIEGRRFFSRHDEELQPTHNLHAFAVGAPEISRHLDFRDYMLAHPEDARRYGTLKSELAKKHPLDIEAYMDGKDVFIKAMIERATKWRAGED